MKKCCGKWKNKGKYCKHCPLKSSESFEETKPSNKKDKKADKKVKKKSKKKKNKE